jgi:hypothetical protein
MALSEMNHFVDFDWYRSTEYQWEQNAFRAEGTNIGRKAQAM